jgi:hypothetical protein
MPMLVDEALLAHPASLERVKAARRAIERAGGNVKLAPPTASGMVLVTLALRTASRHRPSCQGSHSMPSDRGDWSRCLAGGWHPKTARLPLSVVVLGALVPTGSGAGQRTRAG